MTTEEVKLRRYKLPSIEGFGWAIIVIGSDGFFSAVSDYGNYGYLWTHHGCADFRQFLLRANKDTDYFAKKLNPDRVYDEQKTLQGVKERIIELRRDRSWSKDQARAEWDELAAYGELDNEQNFSDWVNGGSMLEEPWTYRCEKLDNQVVAFVEKTMRRLSHLLEKELEAEGIKCGEVIRTVAGIEMKLVEFNTEPECRFNGKCDHLVCMQAKRWRESSCVGCKRPMGRVLWMFTDGQRAAHQDCAYGREHPT